MSRAAKTKLSGASPAERDSVRCDAWISELEAALRRLAKLRADHAKEMDGESWSELHDAGELISKAWNRERGRSEMNVRITD